MALLAGLGSLLGGLSSTKAANTGTQSSTGTTSNTGASTGMSTPTFSGLQQGLQSTAANALTQRINGNINTTPMATAGTDAINTTYKGIGDRLMQSLSSRGFGNSGASGTAALQTEVGRAGAVGNLQSQLQSTALQQQQQAIATAAGMGYAAPGMSTSGSTSNSGVFGNTGSYTTPSSVAAGTLSGGLSSLLGGQNMGTLLSALQAGG